MNTFFAIWNYERELHDSQHHKLQAGGTERWQNQNGKPSLDQMKACKLHNEFYVRQSGVEYVMTLGSYAHGVFTGEVGISRGV